MALSWTVARDMSEIKGANTLPQNSNGETTRKANGKLDIGIPVAQYVQTLPNVGNICRLNDPSFHFIFHVFSFDSPLRVEIKGPMPVSSVDLDPLGCAKKLQG